jgi:hypothetical protein
MIRAGSNNPSSFVPFGTPLTVPAFEGLADGVASDTFEAEAASERVGGVPVVRERPVHVAVTTGDKTDSHPGAREQRTPSPEVAGQELQRGRAGGVDESGVALEGQVVPEPVRLLVRVDMTAHPHDQRRVIQTRAGRLVKAERFPSRSAIRLGRKTCSIGWFQPVHAALRPAALQLLLDQRPSLDRLVLVQPLGHAGKLPTGGHTVSNRSARPSGGR